MLGLRKVDISDLSNDQRVEFISGSCSIESMESKCLHDQILVLYHPVLVEEIREVADKGLVMPPKSTCFELKPRSGMVVRLF